MMETLKKNKLITLLCIIGVVYFFLEFITPLVAPILVAMLFVTIFGPLLKRIQGKLHIHRQIGVIFLMLIFGAVVLLLLWLLFTWVGSSLPMWIQKMDGVMYGLQESVESLCDLGSRITGMNTGYLEEMMLSQMQEEANYLQSQAIPNIVSGSLQYVKSIIKVGGFLLLFVVAAVFLAKDYDHIMNQMLNRKEFHVVLEVICGVIRYIATFVKAQVLIMLTIGALCAVWLPVIGVQGGAFWGILAGILDALPFLGTGIVLVPLAFMQLLAGNYVRALLCIVLYVICIFTREFLEPKLIGGKMGIPPLAVLAAIYAGIQLFGIWGIIKGPLGFMLVYLTFLSLQKQNAWEEKAVE